MKQSGFLAAEKQRRKALLEATQHIERQRMADSVQVAMRRLGYSYAKIKAVMLETQTVVDEFAGAYQGDVNPEADYLRVKMDEAIEEIVRGHQEMIPWKERYPELRSNTALGRLGK